MHRRMVLAAAGTVLCGLAAIAVPAAAPVAARAQTIAVPNPPPRWSPPADRREHAASRHKSCAAFGAGFVNVPGTDACVKVGGWVSVEGTAEH